MAENTRNYHLNLQWTGNTGKGTASYLNYERSFELSGEDKPIFQGSADPTHRGDKAKYNPEEMLLAALSSSQMLWFLQLCAEKGITVLSYQDSPIGVMQEEVQKETDNELLNVVPGRFRRVVLNPTVKLQSKADQQSAQLCQDLAAVRCPISRSVNFMVETIVTFEYASE